MAGPEPLLNDFGIHHRLESRIAFIMIIDCHKKLSAGRICCGLPEIQKRENIA